MKEILNFQNEKEIFLPVEPWAEVSPMCITQKRRYIYQYELVMRYLQNKIYGWNISSFLADQSIHRVVLYAMTEFTPLVVQEISVNANGVEVLAVCDKQYTKYDEFVACRVIGKVELMDLYRTGDVDGILVCSVFHANEIIEELYEEGVCPDDVVSLISAVFYGRRTSI